MARKQKDYLAALLAEDEDTDAPANGAAPSPSPSNGPASSSGPAPAEADTPPPSPAALRAERARGTTLLGRQSAIARVASGEVRQVTQLLLDPARVRVWEGNARSYQHLSEESCRELIDSIIAEGGQKVPAIVRKAKDDPDHDYEVIAGTRRHWSISWLRAHSYPDMKFLAQAVEMDDEAAFRLADLENRARKDVSDLERARNYAAALKTHYDNHLTRMAERLKLSKGWLSKMLKVAKIPDGVVEAFSSPADVQLKPAYPLAQALDDKDRAAAIRREAAKIAKQQQQQRENGAPALPSAEVIARLLAAGQTSDKPEKLVLEGAHGRPAVTVQSSNRQGVTLRLHSGHGLSDKDLLNRLQDALYALEEEGRGLQR
ncbi:ParB family chromosome partitioning protein [Altererythrobacter atlanticus]|uniref:Chromosome-partitioning protein Spo0J n=1 Tax=Croceibacterium atlanticum TaxID=1267766 RepID=A0A0F7KVQ1_9SPHN|nr:ParB/RepB/Spo0J family partition protein [Croceibacterium atlanticum]AKH44307.1 Chromosome-partitioning protein Spo0J [Croceibacterium atlanticum]MBB5733910.1 ParB family chromosome partitioning protein [Croceibacterium atlanticum]